MNKLFSKIILLLMVFTAFPQLSYASFTANKGYNNQATGSNVNTWGIVLNSNFSTIDLNLGGTLSLNVAGNSNVNLSSAQAQNIIHDLNGVLTGNINYTFPAQGGIYLINNNTSGAFTITAMVNGGSGGVVIPQGSGKIILIDTNGPQVISGAAISGENSDITSLTGLTTPLSPAQGGTTIFNGGTTTGSANTQVLASTTPSNFAFAAPNIIIFTSGFANTGDTTINISGTGDIHIKKGDGNAGYVNLTGGELALNQNAILQVWNNSIYILLNPSLALDGSNFSLSSVGSLAFGSAPALPSGTTLASGTTAHTQTAGDTSNDVASDAFVNTTALTLATGTTAVTKTANDRSTKVATTAFVNPANSIGSSGYQELASGVIIEWQPATVAGGGSGTAFSFPLTFPNAVFSVTCNVSNWPTTSPGGVNVGSIGTSGFTAAIYSGGGVFQNGNINCTAIGN